MNVCVVDLLVALGLSAVRRGREWWAVCPFPQHKDSKPSWSIADDSGIHYCFGCGKGGDAVELVAAVIDISRGSARNWIRERGLEIDGTQPLAVRLVVGGRTGRRISLPLGLAGGPLETWPTPVRQYMQLRGVTAWQVVRWGLMYATDGRLEGRVVFPIRDSDGNLLSYTARSYDDREPRYLTPSSDQRVGIAQLFGEQYWGTCWCNAGSSSVVVCEGPVDALACERAGAEFICSLGGSKLTNGIVLMLSKWSEVVIATDPDPPGEAVAEELQTLLARWTKTRRVKLPDGSDAASLQPQHLVDLLQL